MLTYLKKKRFAGARAGIQNVTQSPDISNPFKLNFKVFRPESSSDDLNIFADEAIKKQEWAIRVVHGVNDRSWASIPIKHYENHLNYLKNLSKKKELWVANLSDVVAYSYLRKKFIPVISSSDSKSRITSINFKSSNEEVSDSFNQALKTSNIKKLTLIIQSEHKVKFITQKNKEIAFEIRDNKIITDINPELGSIQLKY